MNSGECLIEHRTRQVGLVLSCLSTALQMLMRSYVYNVGAVCLALSGARESLPWQRLV